MNSDMSMRTIASSVSNRNSASALHSSVLPTPVGPRNRKEPLGRRGSDRPARERRIALATMLQRLRLAHDALGQRLLHAQQLVLLALEHLGDRDAGPLGDHLGDLLLGDAVAHERGSLLLGGLRHDELLLQFRDLAVLQLRHARKVIAAPARVSSSSLSFSISSLTEAAPCMVAFSAFQTSSRSAYSFSSWRSVSSSVARRFLEASSSSLRSATCSILSWMMRRSSLSMTSGLESISMRMRAPASSMRSMALSGSCRSAM